MVVYLTQAGTGLKAHKKAPENPLRMGSTQRINGG